jgi:cytosine deaminase
MTDQPILLCDARLADGRAADLLIRDGRIAAVGAVGSLNQTEGEPPVRIDLGGQLLLPSLVDGHTHLDKTLWGMPWRPHAAEDFRGSRIETEKEERKALPPVEERAGALLRSLVAQGTTATRTHVDVDTEIGLQSLHAILHLRERFADLIDIQIVAFPQSGIYRSPGVADLLDQALSEGADLIGGIDPEAYDGDLDGHLDVVFGLAEKHGKGADIHLHTTGETGWRELAAIVDRAKALGAQDAVTVSHGFCLGELTGDALETQLQAMADAGVSVASSAAGYVPMAPVKALTAKGIPIIAGSDNARDRWGPYGNGDTLERAMLVGWKQNFRRDEDLELAFSMCTAVSREQLGLAEAGTEPGMVADLIALPAECVAEAIVNRPPRTLVMKAGRVLFQAPPQQPPTLALEPKA